ncbi:MAG: class II fructose-bisphosphate aldolase [Bacilli bacterium]|nr:class II fructose-bisphosphate aldolase [Bacilli bacterium]
MLVNSKKMLKKAKKDNQVVFQFNINNLEWTKCILEECDKLKVPVILGVSESAVKYMGGFNVVASLCFSLITDLNIKTDVCLHLDHGSSVESCIKAIDAGFNSVMIDMSKLPIEENIKITKEVVAIAKNNDVSVEAEIGAMGKIQNGGVESGTNTNLEDAILFIKETKVDSLAPAVGTVHGIYKGELNIDYSLIKKLAANLETPLVLHGGSGLSLDILRKCRDAGITKININSDIQDAWSKNVKEYLNENKEEIDPRKIIGSGFEAIKEVVASKININK